MYIQLGDRTKKEENKKLEPLLDLKKSKLNYYRVNLLMQQLKKRQYKRTLDGHY